MEWLGYAATILMGAILGFMGAGGSILTVPILVYLFKMTPDLATGYSLLIVGLTALVGCYSYFRRKQVDFKTGLLFAIPSFLGVFVARRFLVPGLPTEYSSQIIMVSFATLMILASYSMIRGGNFQNKTPLRASNHFLLISSQSLMIGLVTGFVGAGGGFLIIPALVLWIGLEMKTAVGTSLMIITINSIFGFFVHAQTQSRVEWIFPLSLAAVAAVGILLGSRAAANISPAQTKKVFGFFVLLMGALILVEQLFS